MIWRLFYRIVVVPIGWAAFHLLALVDRKAARGLRGRKGWLPRLEKEMARLNDSRNRGGRRVWFHSSSMGEFEQAKPIIAELKRRHPDIRIIVSFFSPSGYEHSRSYKLADVITYLPFDSSRNAERFVQLVRPAAAVIVRYDVWPNHLWALKRAGVPTFIANATLRPDTGRLLPFFRQFHAFLYNSIDYILTVSLDDKDVFQSFHLRKPVVEVIGDTRYDQVWRRSAESKQRHLIDQQILRNRKVLVLGSSWEEDEEMLLPACRKFFAAHPEFLVILVPHEPTLDTLERIESELNGSLTSLRFSQLSDYQGQQVILIDSVGILMALYQYAHVAYIGGSFGSGVHNVLEPAVYGIPILFGPGHTNSREAVELASRGAAFVGRNAEEFYGHLELLLCNDHARRTAGEQALALVRQNVGATERFLSYLAKVL